MALGSSAVAAKAPPMPVALAPCSKMLKPEPKALAPARMNAEMRTQVLLKRRKLDLLSHSCSAGNQFGSDGANHSTTIMVKVRHETRRPARRFSLRRHLVVRRSDLRLSQRSYRHAAGHDGRRRRRGRAESADVDVARRRHGVQERRDALFTRRRQDDFGL